MPQMIPFLALKLVCMWYEESTPQGWHVKKEGAYKYFSFLHVCDEKLKFDRSCGNVVCLYGHFNKLHSRFNNPL